MNQPWNNDVAVSEGQDDDFHDVEVSDEEEEEETGGIPGGGVGT
jgi:hypothetical protein